MPLTEYLNPDWIDPILIIRLKNRMGEFLDEEYLSLTGQLGEEFDEKHFKHVVVDFCELDYFGSTLLEGLFIIWKHVKDRDGQMRICNLSDIGSEIIQVARFDTLWPIHNDCDAAIEAIHEQGV